MTDDYFKKPYRERLKDAFTKTRGQIYAQYSSREKFIYTILIVLGFVIIVSVWVFVLFGYSF